MRAKERQGWKSGRAVARATTMAMVERMEARKCRYPLFSASPGQWSLYTTSISLIPHDRVPVLFCIFRISRSHLSHSLLFGRNDVKVIQSKIHPDPRGVSVKRVHIVGMYRSM